MWFSEAMPISIGPAVFRHELEPVIQQIRKRPGKSRIVMEVTTFIPLPDMLF